MLLEIQNLDFSYDPESPLFENFSLSVPAGKIVALVGESGCGKSTLLSLIYGLFDWSSGNIIFDGRKLMGPKGNLFPGEAEMKLVAQNYDLMPYATVGEIVGKFLSNVRLAEKKAKVLELLNIVGMEDYVNILPKKLSGGQQQRVAISRALSVTPKLLLLDEPFSNLDYSRKIKIREKLFNYVKRENVTLLISTHEIQEVMPWLDELVILQKGKLVQKGSPRDIYSNPQSPYVAELFGEVNTFTEEEKAYWNLEKTFYFPNEISISEQGIEADVVESRFSGSHYWNKLQMNQKTIIQYSNNALSGNIYLEF